MESGGALRLVNHSLCCEKTYCSCVHYYWGQICISGNRSKYLQVVGLHKAQCKTHCFLQFPSWLMHVYRSLGLCLSCLCFTCLCLLCASERLLNLLKLYRVQKPYSWKQYILTQDLIRSSHTHSRLSPFPTKHEIQSYQREMTHHQIWKYRNNKSFASGAKLPNTEAINSFAETSLWSMVTHVLDMVFISCNGP